MRPLLSTPWGLLTAVLASLPGETAAQSTSRASVNSNGEQAVRESCCPTLSSNGRFIVFGSFASNLVPNDGNRSDDVFVRDRVMGTTVRVSVSSSGEQGNNASFPGAISSDGRYVAFQGLATNLVPGDTNAALDVFVCDRDPDGNGYFDEGNGTTVRVSVGSAGEQANGPSDSASISADGRFIAFQSVASNVVSSAPFDTNGSSDIFVHDRLSATTVRVSLRTGGVEANDNSFSPAISADGRHVAFQSLASNLVAGDTNGVSDVFVHDRATGVTNRVSVSSARGQAAGQSVSAAISSNGRYAAFVSFASNLVAADTNGVADVFLHDRDVDDDGIYDEIGAVATVRVSVSSSGAQSNGASTGVALSPDGRYVTFQSAGNNLVAGDTNGREDVFVHDRMTGRTVRASVDSAGVEGNDASGAPSISMDGRFVAFHSIASNLVPGDSNERQDVFLRDHLPCAIGNVNGAAGPVANVFRINGATGYVVAPLGTPIATSLSTAPLGPEPFRYLMWVWFEPPTSQTALSIMDSSIGCTVNPTPLASTTTPQPFRCLRGGLSASLCSGVPEIGGSPARGPWMLTRARGYLRPIVLTVQGLIEDAGSQSSVGVSVTNAVILRVE
jgi:Tol biopolymer transport system component